MDRFVKLEDVHQTLKAGGKADIRVRVSPFDWWVFTMEDREGKLAVVGKGHVFALDSFTDYDDGRAIIRTDTLTGAQSSVSRTEFYDAWNRRQHIRRVSSFMKPLQRFIPAKWFDTLLERYDTPLWDKALEKAKRGEGTLVGFWTDKPPSTLPDGS